MNGKLGWKTITGALIVGSGAILTWLGYPDIGAALEGLGVALGLIGARHAIAKVGQ